MRQLESSGGLGSLLGALLALSCAPSGPPPEPYSIIIVDIDTLRADHLGVYGYSRSTSPNLDAFARQAIVFDWAFSQAPNTPPSQASILTGLYPSTHGMIGDADRLPDSVTTLAEALAEAGFQTAGFHDGAYMRNAFNMGQGFATYKNNRRRGLAAIGPRAMRWLSNHHQEPFLLLIHTYDVHAPYAPPAPFDNAFIDGLEPASPGFSPTAELLNKIRLSKFTDSPIEVAENDLEWSKALYDGGILYVDHWFGTLMETVRELALDERAIIVVISDHGDEFEEHGSLLHEKLYAPVTRVPLMIRLPGGQHAQRITDLVETIDLMPTLLALVGEAIPSAVQGRSLVPLIEGSRTSDSRIAFGESPFFGRRRYVATRDVRLLLTLDTRQAELYRYRQDPLEQIDRSRQEPELVDRLAAELDAWHAMVAAARLEQDGEARELDSETLDDLRALGYLQ